MNDYQSLGAIFVLTSNSEDGPYSLSDLAYLIESRNSSFPAHSKNDSRKLSHAQCHWVAIEIKQRQCPGVGLHLCQVRIICMGTKIRIWHLLLEKNTLPRQFVEGFCDDRESRNKPLIVIARAMKLWSSLTSTGVGHVLTVSTLSGSILMPSEETTCPGNETSLFRN